MEPRIPSTDRCMVGGAERPGLRGGLPTGRRAQLSAHVLFPCSGLGLQYLSVASCVYVAVRSCADRITRKAGGRVKERWEARWAMRPNQSRQGEAGAGPVGKEPGKQGLEKETDQETRCFPGPENTFWRISFCR